MRMSIITRIFNHVNPRPIAHYRTDMEELLQQLSQLDRPPCIDLMEREECPHHHVIVLAIDSDKDKAVGMACLFVLPLLYRKHGLIENVVVHSEYRGRGIAKEMMKAIDFECLIQGVTRLALTSSRPVAQKMYESLGFTEPATKLYRKKL